MRRPTDGRWTSGCGDATALPFADATFDTVTFCLVLCTVPDDGRAVAEAVRVLRPGGRIVAFEHTRSPNRLVRLVEHVMDPFTVRFQGDHMLRDPLDQWPRTGSRWSTSSGGSSA